MRRSLLLLAIAFAATHCSHDTKNKKPTDHLLSWEGIDDLKIGMKQAEVEKLLDQKFILRNARDTADSWVDSATAKYKDMDISLYFQREYTGENDFYMFLTGLRTSSALCQTASGIGIGTERSKIIDAYEDYYLSMNPEDEIDTVVNKSKTKSVMNIRNDDGNRQLIFHLDNKKVAAAEAGIVFHDGE